MPPGDGPRLHLHSYGESWVVVDFSDGEQVVETGVGDVVYVVAGEPHKFTVTGETPARMVCLHQSDRFVTNWLE